MAAEEAETLLDLDEVLGESIDNVDDAPEFITPPDGLFRLSMVGAKAEKYKTTDKESGAEVQKTRLKLIYGVEEVKELSDPEDAPPSKGAMFSEQFMTNKQGLSYFKRQAKNILGEDTIKGATIGQILSELGNGHSFDAEVKVKTSKGKDGQGKERTFQNVQVRIKPGTNKDVPLS